MTPAEDRVIGDGVENAVGSDDDGRTAFEDVFSNRIVGCSITDRMSAKLAVELLRNAVVVRSPDACS